MRKTHRRSILALALLALAACKGNTPAGENATASNDPDAPRQALPRPQSDGRAVTGMPTAGPQPVAVAPGTVAATPAPPPTPATLPPASDGGVAPLPSASVPPSDGGARGAVIGDNTPEPTIDDAVAVIRDYYDAINRGAYEHAYALWSDRGAASGKSLQQFSDGFADTARDSVDIQRPSAVDAAAGSRYLEIPVRLVVTHRDQSSSTYSGSYVLRRSVVDGASAEQRKWRIQSARLQQDE